MKKVLLTVFLVAFVLSFGTMSEAKAIKDLKVAGFFQTAIEEPWDGAIHLALIQKQKELGFTYEFAEKTGASDIERVLREYCERGFDLIIGDAFLAGEEPTRRVAKDYPKVAFAFGSEFKPQAPNYAVFDNWIHEPSYLCGMIAGRMTKTNMLGIVAAMPIAEVNRLVNAFKQGALSVNPKVKVRIVYIGSWFDPAKAKEAAMAQIESGVDLIFAERFGVFEAAKEKKVLVFGNMSDQHALEPSVVVTGPVWNVAPIVQYCVEQVAAGKWKERDLREYSMMAKGGAFLAPLHGFEKKLPAAVIKEVRQKEAAIKSGKFTVPVIETVLKSD
ncbi:MAG: BMP family protein [Synergistaceae bacterium]|nr:BMP family protein [Synergistaceae bacterium]